MKNLENHSLPARSDLPKYTGKYFAIWNGEPVILTIGETGSTITYSGGETDSFYYEDNHGIESWAAVEQIFSSKQLKKERDGARKIAENLRADVCFHLIDWPKFPWEKGSK